MTPTKESLDENLEDWSSLKDDFRKSLLVGNGASINIWGGFAYPSLFDIAGLTKNDNALFASLKTRDFERALNALRIAALVCAQEGHSTRSVKARYASIRKALVDAVAFTHVSWLDVPETTDWALNRAMSKFSHVFSTNYDLLLYWAVMNRPQGFKDFFWGGGTDCVFDHADVNVPPGATKVLYLHGALHLYRHADGSTRKRKANGANLLGALAKANDVPIFVSEGTAAEKLTAIRGNDYLSFARQTFGRECDSLVVFGHGLGASDDHIRRVIRLKCQNLAVALRAGQSDPKIIQRKAVITNLFPNTKIRFFDSESHPMGDSKLHVGP